MASLPPYEILVRWTVVDTTRWLGENGLNDFKDAFKKNGVDGSKLAKLTDSDIDAFNVKPTKKRILLKNAVSSIDKSKVNSLPKTQGMMNAFRRSEFSEPAPPARPPRARAALPPEPPFSHAPPPPASHPNLHQQHHEDEDDNEDAYSWGDDFYQSDSEDSEDYENQQKWTQDHNSNNIGNDSQETYEDMNRTHGDDEEFYEQPTVSPSQSFNGGGILQQLQRELTLRKTAHSETRTHHNHAQSDDEDDDDDTENYELPVGSPTPEAAPSLPPRPGGRKPNRPPKKVEEQVPARPPRPPKHTSPPATQDDDDVYDEPEEEEKKTKRPKEKVESRPRASSRQLPPVPNLPSPKEERQLPPTPKSSKSNANRKPKPPPVQQQQEVYEEVDQGPVQTSNPDTRPPARTPQPVQRTSSRPLPGVPSSNSSKETKKSFKKVSVAKVPPPPRDELDIHDWYHKNIDRQTAEETLKQYGEDGMYLVRKSRRGGTEQQFTLTIYKQDRVYNLPIRKRNKDGKFALGAAKPNELEFDSVPDLVDYFKTKLIMLNPNAQSAAGSTKLIEPLPK